MSTTRCPVGRPGPKNPAVSLTLILGAMAAVYACNDATSPTSTARGSLNQIGAAAAVTPGVTTVCKVGPGATFQVRVGAAAAQTVTVNGGNCANVATVNPAAADDVIVSVAENAAPSSL